MKSICILGYGVEGQSTLQYLLSLGINKEVITVRDRNSGIENMSNGIRYILGDSYLDGITDHDCICKSVGISTLLLDIQNLENIITTQAQIFLDNYQGKVIGVTGTKGKSTISTLICKILYGCGSSVQLIGNIGKPVLDILMQDSLPDMVVYELSSYMCDSIESSIDICLLSNLFYEHHEKWHGSLEKYRGAKAKVFMNAKHKILGTGAVKGLASLGIKQIEADIFGDSGEVTVRGGTIFLGENEFLVIDEILLQGDHNLYNVCGAILACVAVEVHPEAMIDSIKSFGGIEHRMEEVGIYDGIRRINDANASTPESTVAALQAYKTDVGCLFLGGSEAGYDFDEVIMFINAYDIIFIVLFPDTGTRIKSLLPSSCVTIETDSMKEAVDFAKNNTPAGSIALLSCGSPSYSVWSSYIEKGNLFKQYILGNE